jgi:hypothetical protein
MIRSKYQPRMDANRREYKNELQMYPPPLRFLLRPLFPELWRTRWRDRLQIQGDVERDTSHRSFPRHDVAL